MDAWNMCSLVVVVAVAVAANDGSGKNMKSTHFGQQLKTELVALAPNAGGPQGTTALAWVEVTYPSGVSSADDVTVKAAGNDMDSHLGQWSGLDTGGLQLTAKIHGNTLYALKNSGAVPNAGGCCADLLRIYPRDGTSYKDINIDPLVQAATNASDAHASHTFDVTDLSDGSVVALFQVKYSEAELNNAPCDAIVGVNVATGAIVPTAEGHQCFNVWREAGTTSVNETDSRFKIQFYSNYGALSEEWHGNGVQRFVTKDGTSILAFTHRMMAEAVLFKDPWSYNLANGGGSIVQRFGTPWKWTSSVDASYRYFGLKSDASAFSSGVHNVFYRAASDAFPGKETVSLFVNAQDGKSAAYEFVLNLVKEGSDADSGDDLTFATEYSHVACSFQAQAQGGARAIGNGVFLIMSGIDSTGLEVADTSGASHSYAYPSGIANLYDPFIRVTVDDVAASL